ncbi:LLM class flavin-dependent oxidoreductase [Actinoplanes sp. NPDC051343]|uniref:LLM class flavin-dependent oxidoreductase n=1 Tax=Actinoplanes sp. NPDC051343 TaxID=3363906 RepID=UPI0037A34D8E
MTVGYGIYLPPFGPFGDPRDLVELARRAEAAGWDGVFLWDHVTGARSPIVDTWSTLAAMTQVTERLRLGPMVTPLPRRRPWVVARQAATVSRLSGGRLVLGAGLGSDETGDFGAFGEQTGERLRSARLDEGLGLVRRIWAGEEIRHEGEHYRVSLDATTPEPHPLPIWIGSSTGHPRVLERAARADGIFPNPGERTLTPDDVCGLAAAMPRDRPFDIVVRGNASPAWDEPQHADLAGLAEAGMTWWLESLFWLDSLELSMQVVDAGPPGPLGTRP